jgi:melanoma-associated antigen
VQRQNDSDNEGASAVSEPETQTQPANGVETMVKKMVRLALSCEYSRLPIRRGDISTKVLGEAGGRQFKFVFERAQVELRTKFGMQMEELPSREKFTISQRRGRLAIPCLRKKVLLVTDKFSQLHKPLKKPPQRLPSHGS